MIGHNPTTELLKIYDTEKKKPFEFLHTRSFININVATGWVVSTSGKFPYENKIALPVESGDFPVTLEYQPLATIQPNVNETCAPSNFPYIETTGINEVTLYAFAVPSATQMIPIVVTLTQNGSPYGSTNASAARSTIEQTSIQLSQNYFVVETREEKTIQEEVISFRVTAYKGGELINISSSGTPENWLFTQAGLPIEGTGLEVTPSLENEYITATLTIPEGTHLPGGSAIFYFPVQAGGIFYPRATITSTTSSQIIDQVSSYEMIIDDISRATNGIYYVNGVPSGSLKLRVDRKTLNGAVNTVGGRWAFYSKENDFLFERNASGELVLNTQDLQNFNGHNEVTINFYLDNKLLMTKTIYIEITDFSIILQTSVDYVIPDSTPNLRITSYYLLESGTLVSKNGTISVFRNEVGGELIASESNVSSLMVPLQSLDYSSLSRLVITFKDINNNQQEVKIIPVIGVGDTKTEIFNLLTVPSVLTVQTDSNKNIIGGTPQSELFVFRNGEDVTSHFDFTVTPESNNDFKYKIENETIEIENFKTETSQYILNITATHKDNTSLKVQGILQVTRDMEEIAASYYTHIKYTNDPDDPLVPMSDDEGTYRGIAVSISSDAPTNKSAYKWIKNAEGGKGVSTTARHYAISESGTMPPDEDSTDWKGDIPDTADHKGKYLWTKITIIYTEGDPSVVYTVSYIAVDGVAGKDAKLITLSTTAQVFKVSKEETITPATAVITTALQNTTVSGWTYSVNGGTFSSVMPAGVSRAGNTVTITGSAMTATTIAVKATDGTLSDTITIAKVFDGSDGQDGSVLHIRYSFEGDDFSPPQTESDEWGMAPGPYLGNWVTDDPAYKTLSIPEDISEEDRLNLFNNFTWVKIEGNDGRDGNQGTPGGALKIVGPSNLKFYYSGAEYKPVSNILTYSVDSYLNNYTNQQWFFLKNDGEWLEITNADNPSILSLNINEGITTDESSYSVNNLSELTIKVTADLDGNEISDIHTTFFLYSHSGDYFAEILTKGGDTSFSFPKDQYGNIISGTRMSREPLELELFVFKGAQRLTLRSAGESLKDTFDLKGMEIDPDDESIFSLSNQGIDTSVTINEDNQIILTVNNVTENEGKVRFTVIAEGVQEIALEFSWNTYQIMTSKEGSINVYSNFNTFVSNNLSMNQINELLNEEFTLDDSHFITKRLSVSAEARNTSFNKWYYSTDGGFTKMEIISDNNLYSGNLIDDSEGLPAPVAEVTPGQQYLLLSSRVIDYSFQNNNIIIATGQSATGNKTWLTAPNGANQLVIETEEATTALFKIDLSKIAAEHNLVTEKPQYPLENGYSFLHTTTNINEVGAFYNQGLTDPVKWTFQDSQTEIELKKENGNHVIHFDEHLPSDNKFFLNYFSELVIIGEDIEERTSSVVIKREFNPYDSLVKTEEQLDLLTEKGRLDYTDFDSIKNFINNIIEINAGLTKSINTENETRRPAVSNTYNLAKNLIQDFEIPNDEFRFDWEENLETTLKGNPNSFFAATLLEESGYLIKLVLENNHINSEVQLALVSNKEEVTSTIKIPGTSTSETEHYFIIRPRKNTLYEKEEMQVWRDQAATLGSEYTGAANATEIIIDSGLSEMGVSNVIFNFRTTGADKTSSVTGFQVIELHPELTHIGETLKEQYPEVFDVSSDYQTLQDEEFKLRGLVDTLESRFDDITKENIILNEEFSTIIKNHYELEEVFNGLDWLKSKFSKIWGLQEDVRNQIRELQSSTSLKTSFEIKRTSNEMSMGYFDESSFISGLRITPHGTLLKDEKIQIVGSTSIGALYGRKIVIGKDPNLADYADDKTFQNSLDGGFLGIWNQDIDAWASNLDTKGHIFYRYTLKDEDGTAETLKGYMIMNGQEIAAYQYNEAIDNGFREVSPFNILLENYTSYPVFQILDTGVVSVKDISLGSGDGANYREGEMDLFGLTKVIPFAVSNLTIRDLHGTETPGQTRKGIVFIGSGII